jgi:UDP-glucose:glycoprotein glucosyltransferase
MGLYTVVRTSWGERRRKLNIMTGQSEHVPITVHAIADFDSEDGQTLLKEALKMKVGVWLSCFLSSCLSQPQDEDSVTRLSFLHVPSQERQDQKPFVSTLLSHIASTSSKRTATARHLLAALGLNDEDNSRAEKDVLDHRSALQAILDGTVLEKVDSRQYDEYVRFSTAVLRRVGLSPGAMALIVNGRVRPRWCFSCLTSGSRCCTDHQFIPS